MSANNKLHWIADVRRRSIIKSPIGNLMIIPRERKLVRIYVQVSSELAQEYRAKNGDPEVIMQTVRDIMKPYRFEASRLEWSTIYVVSNPREKEKEARQLTR